MDDLLDTAPAGFLRFTDDGTIVAVNRTLAKLLGYKGPEELQGRYIDSILPVASRIFYQTHFFPLLKLHAEANEIYLSLRSRAGSEVPVLLNAVRRESQSDAVNDCILISIRQRSEYEDEILRARAVAEEAARSKDEFLATVSHELRTPLNAILGWATMVGRGQLDKEMIPQAMEVIERNAKAQTQLIEDILDFARITSGKLRLDVSQLEPADVVEAAIDVLHPTAEAKGIRVQSIIARNAGLVSGDFGRLQQVLWNLLSNAIKFTPRGGRVQVRLERVNSHVEITVSDTGQGISPEFLPYVFERFRQADGSTTRRHSGLGLGMAISRQIVELHGGTIRVYSGGEGQGATFVVELPLLVVHQSDEVKSNGSEQECHTGTCNSNELPVLTGIQVLVLDDDRDSRELLSVILTERCAQVTVVGTVVEALEVTRLGRPDVIISDIEMPGEDGYSFIRNLRALEKQHGGWTPAIALTAHVRHADRMRALTAGFQLHLAKPVVPAELIVLIANLCQKSQSM